MLKQNKGITLVALVITIIVLLILAGVSISLVVGDNGVMTRATDASSKTKYAQAKEAMGIAINELQTEYFESFMTDANDTLSKHLTPAKLNEKLNNQGYKLCVNSTGTVATGLKAEDNTKTNDSTDKGFTKTTGSGETATVNYFDFYIMEDNGTSDYVATKVKVDTINATVTYASTLSSGTAANP